ncbi:MAG: hypothetical protein HON14_07740 [Rhodospirillaceae bacterium]|jgi:thioredoxin-related protein|nr:hypothetical protein [Rhodospirillaceae bacterium]MBT4589563.1 hypothetical protein [Rhodospirillaceae bacterium]MBT4939006.1 hypothetical protein [Rhodospirillaceae bacterium]MBT7265563.1 hypothetical protein [Rhodospirillaceae bacterium]
MHQKIIKDVVSNLDEERSKYFGIVLNTLANDSRAQLAPNLVYAVLKEVVALVPPYLPSNDFINMLFGFVGDNAQKITAVMYSHQYVTDSLVLQMVTNDFVDQVIEMTYQMHQEGAIETGEKKVRSYSWPYDNADFPFAD